MKSEKHIEFIDQSQNISFDLKHRNILKKNISHYENALNIGKEQFKNLELAKKRASNIKHRAINNLDKYLITFESNFSKRGGKVIWALDAKQAVDEIINILDKKEIRTVVKSKSSTSHEIEINENLKKKNIEPVETDLGEFIAQINDEKPYHIISPIIQKSKEEVSQIFNKKYNLPVNSLPEEITSFVRNLLREEFINSNASITGANFLIADIGGVVITENEGNALLCSSLPKVHIVLAGIEKIIPSVNDLDLMLPLLATHGTGQKITVYNTIITGPRQENEIDGPDEMYVILLDNNRTKILSKKEQRNALSCIKCGACLNSCPIYRTVGGKTYGSAYSGPIAAVTIPIMYGYSNYKHLSYASTLCGKCTEVCPVKIPLHELLIFNRHEIVKESKPELKEKIALLLIKKVLLNRKLMNFASNKTKDKILSKLFRKGWGNKRQLPVFAEKTFNQIWKEKNLAQNK
jgi:L-lactate dehydrogenase complex protein LldF